MGSTLMEVGHTHRAEVVVPNFLQGTSSVVHSPWVQGGHEVGMAAAMGHIPTPHLVGDEDRRVFEAALGCMLEAGNQSHLAAAEEHFLLSESRGIRRLHRAARSVSQSFHVDFELEHLTFVDLLAVEPSRR